MTQSIPNTQSKQRAQSTRRARKGTDKAGKSAHKKLTRRRFTLGAVGAATAALSAATALSLNGCRGGGSTSTNLTEHVREQFPDATVEYLDVDPAEVLSYTDMEMIAPANYLAEKLSFDLPLGSLVYQSSHTHALVITPGATSSSLIRLGMANLDSGEFIPLLGQALGSDEDYVIYDARASASAIIWVECNMVHGLWKVYATSFSAGVVDEEALRQAELVDEGGSTYSPPQLAAAQNKVYWTVMPDPNGPASTEDSYLKAIDFSPRGGAAASGEPYTVYVSHGRMITVPTVSEEVLTIAPRVDTDNVYYQLTTLDIATDAVLNIAILPPSLRVSDAVWLKDGFAFSIEGNYDYAKGLAYLGTYQQLGSGQYLYVNKAPVSAPVQVGSIAYVKSTKNVLGLDVGSGSAVIVNTLQECVDYGDLLAGAGTQDRLVLYTTVAIGTGKASSICRVRVFDPL